MLLCIACIVVYRIMRPNYACGPDACGVANSLSQSDSGLTLRSYSLSQSDSGLTLRSLGTPDASRKVPRIVLVGVGVATYRC
jgi:hypothetical protein